jgi:hypothetical protein
MTDNLLHSWSLSPYLPAPPPPQCPVNGCDSICLFHKWRHGVWPVGGSGAGSSSHCLSCQAIAKLPHFKMGYALPLTSWIRSHFDGPDVLNSLSTLERLYFIPSCSVKLCRLYPWTKLTATVCLKYRRCYVMQWAGKLAAINVICYQGGP